MTAKNDGTNSAAPVKVRFPGTLETVGNRSLTVAALMWAEDVNGQRETDNGKRITDNAVSCRSCD